jgi:hypothetical protein
VKLKKPDDKTDLFVSEFKIGRFFTKYYFVIIIQLFCRKRNFVVNYYDKINSKDNKHMGIVLEYLNYEV